MDPAALPPRTRTDEDAWVAGWAASDDLDGLVEAVATAIEARRPQLAARLVGLVPKGAELDDPAPVESARRAAQMLLIDPSGEAAWCELEDAWTALRRERMRRIKRRQRLALQGKQRRTGRLDGRKRR